MNLIKKWLSIQTLDGKKIDNFIIALNYLADIKGSNIVLGTIYLNSIMTEECFNKLVEYGYLIKFDDGWFKFTRFGKL